MRFLGRDRSLGESRLLWEIGAGDREVRALRNDLDLDSGYLSRLLRSLERDPAHPHARHCLDAYFAELDDRFDIGFDPTASNPAAAEDMRPPAGVFLVATLRSEPVGCGALKLHGTQPAELKRMWVDGATRGLGLGRRLLSELEGCAREHGVRRVRLETNHTLVEAIALYRSCGYTEVDAFNDEPYADHWFEKRLAAG